MQISQDCLYCKKMSKKLMEQVMGPLTDNQLSISPVFYVTLVDLWGPIKCYAPGYHRETRSVHSKPYDGYFMVFACCSTGTVNVQFIEGKNTESCLSGFNRFFNETSVPKIILTDAEGGLLKSLKEGEIDIQDLQGTLSTERNIHFEVATPQAHYQHGKIEKKIHLLQESLERSELKNTATSATGWMTVGKMIERNVNSIPLGYLFHGSGGNNPILRILSPNSLRLITASDRAPVGLFDIPHSVNDLLDNIEQKYLLWYEVWNTGYLPLIMNRQKWHFSSENLIVGDIVYFKLTESKMSSQWRVGKVEKVMVGDDGFVRRAIISYKDTSSDCSEDWLHRTVERPVRNLVKLFNIEETSLMDDIANARKLAQDILDSKKISSNKDYFEDNEEEKQFDTKLETNSEPSLEDEDVPNEEIPIEEDLEVNLEVKKPRKKRRNELENLEIDMKGWNYIYHNEELKEIVNYSLILSENDTTKTTSNSQEDDAFTEILNEVYPMHEFDSSIYLI